MAKRREYRKSSFSASAESEVDASTAEPPVGKASDPMPSPQEPMVQEPIPFEPATMDQEPGDAPFGTSEGYKDLPPISPEDRNIDLSGLDIEVEDFLDEDSEYGKIPQPEVFNAYPPEVQRKIMEWTDRDIKARRDDESRRRDEIMRAQIDNKRRRQMFPAIITVLAMICAAVTGVVTANPLFPLVFMLVPLAVIAARVAGDDGSGGRGNRRNKPPQV